MIEDPVGMEGSGLGDWTGPYQRGTRGDRFKHDELQAAEAMIYGRRTYDAFAAVWPTVIDPEGYAARMNAMPKLVASRTLERAPWSNSKVIEDDLIDAARTLREEIAGDILIFGSASIVHQLMPHDLLDEFRLMVYPTVLGRGKRLFPDGKPVRLRLEQVDRFDDGIILLRYVVSRQAGRSFDMPD